MITRVVPSPFILDPIPEEKEEEEEDDEDNVSLKRITWLARSIEKERRKSSTATLPPIPKEPLQMTTSEDEMKQWIVK